MGCIIDETLKWKGHAEYLNNKIRSLIHKFYLLREIMNQKTLIMIYKSLIESILRYAIEIWGGIYDNALHALTISHKYLIKTMLKRSRYYPTALLYTNEIVDIRTLYIVCVTSYIRFKLKPNTINHIYSTRKKINKNIPTNINKNEVHARSTNYLGIKMYNVLPNTICKIPKPHTFREKCKTYVLNNKDIFSIIFSR